VQFQKKAQGAIEYLLIIGAAILVVAIVTGIIIVAVNQGQTQTTEGSSKAYDALHDLAVTGMGYEIELTLADYTGYSGYSPFPIPTSVDCNNPITQTRAACFYEKTIAHLVIDGITVDTYDLTGINGKIGQSKKFNYSFNGDPNKIHNLKIVYDDCWAGYGKTGDPTIDSRLYVINGSGTKCSDESIAIGAVCTMCNDFNL